MKNSMVSNPKLVALLERVDQLVTEKKSNGMSGSSMILNSALLQAADEYGVDLHRLEHAIEFSGEDYPVVASHECELSATVVEGPSSTAEPFSIVHDRDCASYCGADLANISTQFDEPTKQYVAFVVHDTIGETIDGDLCYGASFQVFAQGKTEAEVTAQVATGHYKHNKGGPNC